MSKITEETKVIVIGENNEIRKGTVKKAYELLEVAIVKMDDGNVEKIPFSRIGIETQEETDEPVEKSEITITPEEFREITSEVIAKESVTGGPLLMAIGTILIAKIHEALFYDAVDND